VDVSPVPRQGRQARITSPAVLGCGARRTVFSLRSFQPHYHNASDLVFVCVGDCTTPAFIRTAPPKMASRCPAAAPPGARAQRAAAQARAGHGTRHRRRCRRRVLWWGARASPSRDSHLAGALAAQHSRWWGWDPAPTSAGLAGMTIEPPNAEGAAFLALPRRAAPAGMNGWAGAGGRALGSTGAAGRCSVSGGAVWPQGYTLRPLVTTNLARPPPILTPYPSLRERQGRARPCRRTGRTVLPTSAAVRVRRHATLGASSCQSARLPRVRRRARTRPAGGGTAA
jgi:hypothetical protein